MTIKLYIGNVGSGKTAYAVREMSKSNIQYISNIRTNKIKNNMLIKTEHIIKKDFIRTTKAGEDLFKYSFNKDFWIKLRDKYKQISLIIDEAHTVFSSRRSTSKQNVIMSDFIALARKLIGDQVSGYGDIVFISQLSRRIDVIARDMCHQVKYFKMYYVKYCTICSACWAEHSDMPELQIRCPKCRSGQLKKRNFKMVVMSFQGIEKFMRWQDFGSNTYYSKKQINNIENIFSNYDTLQWDNLLSDY